VEKDEVVVVVVVLVVVVVGIVRDAPDTTLCHDGRGI